jgi:hypothetical protein
MPFKDKEDQKKYERERYRSKRSDAEHFAGELDANEVAQRLDLPSMPTIDDMIAVLSQEVNNVRACSMDALARGRCIGYLTGVLLKATEASEIDRRLATLEESFDAYEQRTKRTMQ